MKILNERWSKLKELFYIENMSWYVAATVNSAPDDHYIFINNSSYPDTYILPQNILSQYAYLDYILVGGGGGGGGGCDGQGVSNYGGGGGGSGNLESSFALQTSNGGFNYNVIDTGQTTIDIVSFDVTSITVQIGGGGGPGSGCNLTDPGNCNGGLQGSDTKLTITSSSNPTQILTATGGIGGQGGGYTCGGNGGNGFNGGGGGGGGDCGGTGGSNGGGQDGGNGDGDNGGNGGGLGGGQGGQGHGEEDGDNTGGGGGGGTGIENLNTGGQGAESFRIDANRPSSSGVNYTGGGGGGGTSNIGSGYQEPSSGGKGYAILWLHN